MPLFGKKKVQPPTTQEAIQKLRNTEEMLGKKQEFLEKKVQMELQNAKKHGTKNKRAALQALQRKKNYEKQLNQIDGTLTTIESQRQALENSSTNVEVMNAMKVASDSLKGVHKNMNIDQVHDVMDDIQEQQEIANEIADAISSPVGFGHDIDEDELMNELEELEQEDLNEKLLDVGGGNVSVPELPGVPADRLPAASSKKANTEADEMAELEAWAS